MSEKKLLIIDTSVLLYDKTSIHSFHGNCIVLPMVVLDELDKFKEKPGLLGESARYINRFLDGLRKNNRLDEGAHVEEYDIKQRDYPTQLLENGDYLFVITNDIRYQDTEFSISVAGFNIDWRFINETADELTDFEGNALGGAILTEIDFGSIVTA